VSPLFKLKFYPGEQVLDLGTGGGLPGIPLKILLPDFPFVLLDATHKKILAVQDIIHRLGLTGVRALWGRAEDLAKDENLFSQFGYIVVRAVAPLKDLIKWSSPFAKRENQTEIGSQPPANMVIPPALVALKGGDLEQEIEDAKLKKPMHGIATVNLSFQGSEEMTVTDKKVVIVQL
jgi:16S rRNA (guanine527-N7)-methyltransferase